MGILEQWKLDKKVVLKSIQYNTISFNGTKNTLADTDATEYYTRKKLNNTA